MEIFFQWIRKHIFLISTFLAIVTSSLLTGCIKSEYDNARGFHQGYAAVKINRKWGFIDTTGKIVLPCRYDKVVDCNDGSYLLEKNGYWGIAGTTVVMVTPKYKEIDYLKYEKYIARGEYGWSIIDKTGKELTSGYYQKYEIRYLNKIIIVR